MRAADKITRPLRGTTARSVVFVAAFAVVGSALLLLSHAATSTFSAEPEAGTVQGNSLVVSDGGASGGQAVLFGKPAIRNIDDKGYGIAANLLILSAAQQDAELADLKSLGISWVRSDFGWSSIQPTSGGAYNWAPYDSLVAKAASYGIKVDAIIDYSTPWANSSGCSNNLCQPADPAQYAAYAKAVVQHFGARLGAVEIWNEPDILQFWNPAVNVDAYTAMLKLAYTAIKSVDPGMLVMSAGLSPGTNGTNFVSGMYNAGAKNYFDVLAYHPYSYPALPADYEAWSGWSTLTQTPANVRGIMAANNDDAKSVWLTEVGAPTGGPKVLTTCDMANSHGYVANSDHVDECLQAEILSQAITVGRSYPWTGVIFLYTYKDGGTSTSTKENFFGLLRYDGSQKPSYDAVKQAIAAN